MIISGKTDIGQIRQENQDTWRAGRKGNAFAWAAVCDGMGGQRAGRLASTTAIESIEHDFSQKDFSNNPQDILYSIIKKSNTAVYQAAYAGGSATFGMGTTVVAAVLKEKHIFYAHVGDSRIYLFRHQTLVQLTRDHSRVQEMVEAGEITQQQARIHPDRNRITRALGVEAEVQVDVASIPVQIGDEILLCSDGLSNQLSDEMIVQVLSKYSIYEQPEALIQLANQNGGPDNITAVVMQITQEDING